MLSNALSVSTKVMVHSTLCFAPDLPQCENVVRTTPSWSKASLFSPDVLIHGVCQALTNKFGENLACEIK